MTEPEVLCDVPHPTNPEWTCTKPKRICYRQHVHLVIDRVTGEQQIKAAWPNAAEPPTAKPSAKSTAKLTTMAQRTKGDARTGAPGLSASLTAVDANADVDFKEEAKAVLRQVATEMEEFNTEDILDRMTATTHDNRALGPIMLWAKSQGLIRKTEPERFVPSRYPDRHLADQRVWQSLVYTPTT